MHEKKESLIQSFDGKMKNIQLKEKNNEKENMRRMGLEDKEIGNTKEQQQNKGTY
jgi:hypothetical protein